MFMQRVHILQIFAKTTLEPIKFPMFFRGVTHITEDVFLQGLYTLCLLFQDILLMYEVSRKLLGQIKWKSINRKFSSSAQELLFIKVEKMEAYAFRTSPPKSGEKSKHATIKPCFL